MVVFKTFKFAIGVDLRNGKEIFRVESIGFFSTCISGKPLIFKEEKVLLDDKQILSYGDIMKTQVHHSPDGLKVLILDGNRTIYIFFLHDIAKLEQTSKNIPLESDDVSICWLQNSEKIVIAYKEKF